jgi:hypothetical protein
MREGFTDDSAFSDTIPGEPRSSVSFRWVVALSIPACLVLVWIIPLWFPACSFLAIVPAIFALHSAAILLSGRKE